MLVPKHREDQTFSQIQCLVNCHGQPLHFLHCAYVPEGRMLTQQAQQGHKLTWKRATWSWWCGKIHLFTAIEGGTMPGYCASIWAFAWAQECIFLILHENPTREKRHQECHLIWQWLIGAFQYELHELLNYTMFTATYAQPLPEVPNSLCMWQNQHWAQCNGCFWASLVHCPTSVPVAYSGS